MEVEGSLWVSKGGNCAPSRLVRTRALEPAWDHFEGNLWPFKPKPGEKPEGEGVGGACGAASKRGGQRWTGEERKRRKRNDDGGSAANWQRSD